MKTIRFATVVEKAGKPEAYTLWQDPEKDQEFQKALSDDCVMTIIREPATTKADVASVGYVKQPNALYLIFPRPVTAFKENRIVGIKEDLLALPKPKGEVVKVSEPKKQVFTPFRPPRSAIVITPSPEPSPAPVIEPRSQPAAKPVVKSPPTEPIQAVEPSPPKPKPLPRFQVTASITGAVERTIEVTAKNRQEARESAAALLKDQSVDFSVGTRQVKIAKVAKT
jgi:hypothetical protein